MSVYAFSDIHGNYELFIKIKNYIKEDDTVYCLGDCCDRGADGIKIMQEVLADKRFIYILGNHEVLFMDAVRQASPDGRFSFRHFDKQDLELLCYNGTDNTLHEFTSLTDQEQQDLTEALTHQPVYKEYINKNNQTIFLSHAGGNPLNLYFPKRDFEYYWDRKHISKQGWDNQFYPNLYVVHGHTPVQCIPLYNQQVKVSAYDKVCFYCEGHKIDIDLGTPTTNTVALLNLDTFETIYFKQDDKSSLDN